MTVRSKTELYELFEGGDRPRAQDFIDLIDSFLDANFDNWPDELPPADGSALTALTLPDPLPEVSGEQLTNINRSDWILLDDPPVFADATHFNIAGDYTAMFVSGRRTRIGLQPTGFHLTSVVSSSYDGPSDLTLVEVEDAIPVSALGAVEVNVFVDSDIVITSLQPGSGDPLSVYRKNAGGTNVEAWTIPENSAAAPGLVELATDGEAQAMTSTARGVTPANLAAALVSAPTALRGIRRDASGRAQVASPSATNDIANKSYTDTQDAATLASSQGYADSGDAATLASAQGYADSGDATTLTSAQGYADSGDAATLASAQGYTDTHAGATSNPHSVTKAQVGLGNVTNNAQWHDALINKTATASKGHYELPDGLTLNWGFQSVAGNGVVDVTLSRAYQSVHLIAVASYQSNVLLSHDPNAFAYQQSLTQIRIGNGHGAAHTVAWFSLGI